MAARYENFTVHSSVVERATTGVGRKGVAVEAGSVVRARFLGARDSCFANTTCELAVANTGVVLKGWLFKKNHDIGGGLSGPHGGSPEITS